MTDQSAEWELEGDRAARAFALHAGADALRNLAVKVEAELSALTPPAAMVVMARAAALEMEAQAAALDGSDYAPACRVCGCTDEFACEGGCTWVPDLTLAGDLCSRCEGLVIVALPDLRAALVELGGHEPAAEPPEHRTACWRCRLRLAALDAEEQER